MNITIHGNIDQLQSKRKPNIIDTKQNKDDRDKILTVHKLENILFYIISSSSNILFYSIGIIFLIEHETNFISNITNIEEHTSYRYRLYYAFLITIFSFIICSLLLSTSCIFNIIYNYVHNKYYTQHGNNIWYNKILCFLMILYPSFWLISMYINSKIITSCYNKNIINNQDNDKEEQSLHVNGSWPHQIADSSTIIFNGSSIIYILISILKILLYIISLFSIIGLIMNGVSLFKDEYKIIFHIFSSSGVLINILHIIIFIISSITNKLYCSQDHINKLLFAKDNHIEFTNIIINSINGNIIEKKKYSYKELLHLYIPMNIILILTNLLILLISLGTLLWCNISFNSTSLRTNIIPFTLLNIYNIRFIIDIFLSHHKNLNLNENIQKDILVFHNQRKDTKQMSFFRSMWDMCKKNRNNNKSSTKSKSKNNQGQENANDGGLSQD